MGRALRALIFDGQISLTVMDTTDIVQKAVTYHNLSPLSAAALGRTITAGVFMALGLKNDGDKFSVTVKGNGVGGSIVVCGNSALEMRGTIDNPRAVLPLKSNGKLNVAGCVGTEGRITVIRDIGLKKPYSGSCPLVSGELAEDFAAYYTYSEQQPTAMALGVKIGVDYSCVGAGGVVVQTMPGCEEKNIALAEELISNFSNISGMIESAGIDGIVEKFFPNVAFNEYKSVYKCICNREYIERVLLSMGKKELEAALKEQGKI
ncbi:MAG: Hsp33 family molecular chaperone HslO, partial [Clostridia bacterium]|nr:Hsp33 family molecular chaperone HslO [Clostridia bacterium]